MKNAFEQWWLEYKQTGEDISYLDAKSGWNECKKQIMEYLNAKLIDDDGDPMNFVVKEDIRNIEKIF